MELSNILSYISPFFRKYVFRSIVYLSSLSVLWKKMSVEENLPVSCSARCVSDPSVAHMNWSFCGLVRFPIMG